MSQRFSNPNRSSKRQRDTLSDDHDLKKKTWDMRKLRLDTISAYVTLVGKLVILTAFLGAVLIWIYLHTLHLDYLLPRVLTSFSGILPLLLASIVIVAAGAFAVTIIAVPWTTVPGISALRADTKSKRIVSISVLLIYVLDYITYFIVSIEFDPSVSVAILVGAFVLYPLCVVSVWHFYFGIGAAKRLELAATVAGFAVYGLFLSLPLLLGSHVIEALKISTSTAYAYMGAFGLVLAVFYAISTIVAEAIISEWPKSKGSVAPLSISVGILLLWLIFNFFGSNLLRNAAQLTGIRNASPVPDLIKDANVVPYLCSDDRWRRYQQKEGIVVAAFSPFSYGDVTVLCPEDMSQSDGNDPVKIDGRQCLVLDSKLVQPYPTSGLFHAMLTGPFTPSPSCAATQ
jgi:hypothetical protein